MLSNSICIGKLGIAHNIMQKTQAQRRTEWIQQFPVYYGWVVWVGSMVALITSFPGQSFTVSLFFDYFIDDFNINRTSLSAIYGIGTFIASLSLTWIGRGIDKYGNRSMATIISGLFAIALVYMSFVFHPVMLVIGFILIRGLGQGSMGIIGSTAVAQWFGKRRGRMMGMATVAFAVGQAFYIPHLETLLENNDWRDVWRMLAVVVGLVMLPLVWLLLRNTPEEFGLKLDGLKTSNNEDTELAIEEENWTLQEARRTPLFWIYLFAQMMPPLLATGLIIHSVSIFEELGYSRRVTADTYGMVGLVSAFFALSGGFIVDKIAPGKVIAWELFSLAMALGFSMIMTESWMLYLYAVTYGLAMGFSGVIAGTVWANIFGRTHQGSIRGFVTTAAVIGTSIGPILFGSIFDVTGSYTPALWMGIVFCVVLGALAFWVKLPHYTDYVSSST